MLSSPSVLHSSTTQFITLPHILSPPSHVTVLCQYDSQCTISSSGYLLIQKIKCSSTYSICTIYLQSGVIYNFIHDVMRHLLSF
jgi:hypothetical protein